GSGCLLADVPAALLLSDGIDSNAVRAALSAQGHDVPSFTYRLSDLDPTTSPARVEGDVDDLLVSRGDRLERMHRALSTMTEPVAHGAPLATSIPIPHSPQHPH